MCKRLGVNKPPRGYWNRINSGMTHENALNPPPKIVDEKFKKDILKDEDILEIFNLLKENNLSMRKIADRYGRSRTCVNKIKKRIDGYGKVLDKYGI